MFNSTEGDFPGFPDVIIVDADLTQSVPATVGQTYKMTGYAYFEGGYAGGVDTIDLFSGTTRAGLPSLTKLISRSSSLTPAAACCPVPSCSIFGRTAR